MKIPELTKEQQQMLVAGILCLGAFGFIYYKYLWSPVSLRITKASQKLDVIARDITSAQTQEQRLDKLKETVADLKNQAQAAERRLPKGRNFPDLIYTINDLGKKYDVEIRSISPQGKADKQYFAEVYYGITCAGTYHSVGKFLTALGISERIFSTQNLVLTPSGGATGATVSATFTLVAYQYKG